MSVTCPVAFVCPHARPHHPVRQRQPHHLRHLVRPRTRCTHHVLRNDPPFVRHHRRHPTFLHLDLLHRLPGTKLRPVLRAPMDMAFVALSGWAWPSLGVYIAPNHSPFIDGMSSFTSSIGQKPGLDPELFPNLQPRLDPTENFLVPGQRQRSALVPLHVRPQVPLHLPATRLPRPS